MDLKSYSVTADILNCLTDGKRHTMSEIAERVEVSRQTVSKHIGSLSYRYPIEVTVGGRDTGGVLLDRKYFAPNGILTKDQLQMIRKGLALLQQAQDPTVDPKELTDLIRIYAPEQCGRCQN